MNSRNVFLSGHKRAYDLSLGYIVISFGALFQLVRRISAILGGNRALYDKSVKLGTLIL